MDLLTRRKVLMVIAVAALAIGVVFWRVLPRDHISHVSPSQALHLFKQHMHGDAEVKPAGGPWPQLGVYLYKTQGSEHIEVGPLSRSHDYGGESTVILWTGRCGVVERWQVLATRWSESETCRGRRSGRLTTLREFREFYGVAQEDSFTCEGRSVAAVSDSRPGQRLWSTCKSTTGSVIRDIKVVGATQLRVGGEMVDAVHLTGTSTARGRSTGTAKVEEWRRRADGLLLRRRVDGTFDSDAHGGTSYDEDYLIELISLRPER